MILRWAAHFGYRIPDLAWLKLRELEYLHEEPEANEGVKGGSDVAFTI